MALLLALAVLLTTCLAVVLVVRRSWPRWRAVVVESVVDPVRTWLSPPQQVPLATLQRRWLARALRLVTVTVSGRTALPHALVFVVSPADLDRLHGLHDLVEEDSATAMRAKARRHDWDVPARFHVVLEADERVVDGRPVARLPRRAVPTGALGSVSSWSGVSPSARTAVLPPADTTPAAGVPGRTVTEATAEVAVAAAAHPGLAHGRTSTYVRCELIALDDGNDVPLDRTSATVVVGRDAGCDVTLADTVVSGVHAQLVSRNGQWVVSDRASLNGTWVNGDRVAEAALVHNDEVSFGLHGPRFVFSRLSRDLPAVR